MTTRIDEKFMMDNGIEITAADRKKLPVDVKLFSSDVFSDIEFPGGKRVYVDDTIPYDGSVARVVAIEWLGKEL